MSARQPVVSRTAPGKVNLYFAVGDVQENGYHPVASLYAAVALEERVTVTASGQPGITLSLDVVADSVLGQMEAEGNFDRDSVPLDENNLAWRAAELVLAEHGLSPKEYGLHLHIDKQVPVAGGMAGGSADAAAALKAVNAFVVEAAWAQSEISAQRLRQLGAGLGADVPFCLVGGLALGYGVGDELIPLDVPREMQPLPLVMVFSTSGLSTPAVFRALDEGRASGEFPPAPAELRVPQELIDLLTASKEIDYQRLVKLMHNDLQAPAVKLLPELAETLAETPPGIAGAMVSGSGPSLLMVAANPLTAATQEGQRAFTEITFGRQFD